MEISVVEVLDIDAERVSAEVIPTVLR